MNKSSQESNTTLEDRDDQPKEQESDTYRPTNQTDIEFSNMGTATICGPSGSMCHGRFVSPGHVKVNVKSLCGGASVPYPWTQTINWFTEPVMAHSFLIWPVKFLKAAGTEIE